MKTIHVMLAGLLMVSLVTAQTASVRTTDSQASFVKGVRGSTCPEVERPVCGMDEKTYGNSCKARRAGVRYRPGSCDRKQLLCSTEFSPVCGSVEGRQRTFPNTCRAEYAGATNIVAGKCSEGVTKTNKTAHVAMAGRDRCPRVVKPVCGTDGITYANACKARKSGVDFKEGDCFRDVKTMPRMAKKEIKRERKLHRFSMTESRERVQQSRTALRAIKDAVRSCKGLNTPQCKDVRKSTRQDIANMYFTIVHSRILLLEKSKERILASEWSQERKDRVVASIDHSLEELNTLRDEAEAFENPANEELRTFHARLKAVLKDSTPAVREGQAVNAVTKLEKAHTKLARQVERVSVYVQENGLVAYQERVDGLASRVTSLKKDISSLESLILSGETEKARALLKQVITSVRQTHKDLTVLVGEIKSA